MPFRTLLYRYFFFGWLFKDVNARSPLERAAAWRHNRAESRWLATYLRRWTALGGVLFLCGALIERLDAPMLSAVFYVQFAWAVAVIAVIAALIVAFGTFD